jgi:hypothetical protein
MTTGTRIPRGIEDFNPYIANTNAYLLAGTPTTNAVRLGILPDEVSQWSDIATTWSPLYVKYSDKKNSRTTAIKDQLLSLIDQCVELDLTCHLLDRIAASPNVTIEDMGAFNIKKGILMKTTRSIPQTPITEPVTVTIQPLGGGSITIKCYSTTGERAAIYDDADSVQFVYQVGGTPPVAADVSGLEKDISTKAIFTLALGSSSSAKYLYIYFRWYDTKRPNLAGPWSAMQTTLIL